MSSGGSLRILFCMPSSPIPLQTGASQRTVLMFRALNQIAAVDTFVALTPDEPYLHSSEGDLRTQYHVLQVHRLRARGAVYPWRMVRRVRPRLADLAARALGDPMVDYLPYRPIQKWFSEQLKARRYDLVVGRYLHVVAQAGALNQDRVPVAVDVDDLPTEACHSRMNSTRSKGIVRFLEGRRLRSLEVGLPSLLARCSATWVANADHRQQPGLSSAIYLPNVPFATNGVPSPEKPDSKQVLFVGSFAHGPNVRGLAVFLERIWPQVLASHPDAELILVGSGMSDQARSRYQRYKNVRALGFIPDLRPAYADAAFSIVPVFEGSGTNIKLVESLMHGRSVVVTGYGHRGYGHLLRDGESLLVGPTHSDVASSCVRLLTDVDLRARLSQTGHALVRSRFSHSVFTEAVRTGVCKALAQRSDRCPSRS